MTMTTSTSSSPSRGGGHLLFRVVLVLWCCLLGDVTSSSFSASTTTATASPAASGGDDHYYNNAAASSRQEERQGQAATTTVVILKTTTTTTTDVSSPRRMSTLTSSFSSSLSFRRRRHYPPPAKKRIASSTLYPCRGGGGGGGGNSHGNYQHYQRRRNNAPSTTASSTTATSTVFNLVKDYAHLFITNNNVKSIMGAAIFTIPAGMATFSDSKRAIWFPTLGLLLGIGFLSAKSFVWIGQVCEETGAISYPQAWSHSIGPSTQWIPHIASLLTTLQAIVSYAIVLSTTLPQLWQALSSYFGIGIVAVSRRQALVGLMGGVLLPLCLLRSLSALAPFSFVGLLGLVYTAIVMTIRYLDGSYSSTTSSGDATAVIPSFGNRLDWWHPAVLVLAAKLGNAYMAHYQAPTMYHELWQGDNNHKHNDKKKTQFQKVVQISYLIVACLYTWMTMVGFGTFGAASTSFVLDSYSTTHDGLISASRCAIFVSLLCSFPLVFSGFRTSILTTMMTMTASTTRTTPSATSHTLWTVGLLSMITLLAYFVTDIGTLLSFGGGTYVCWLTFVFPPLMILKLSCRQSQLQSERPMAILTLVVGVILSMVGMQQFYQTHLLL